MDTLENRQSLHRSLSEPSLFTMQQRNASNSRFDKQSLSNGRTKRSMSLTDPTSRINTSFQNTNSKLFTHTKSKEDGPSPTDLVLELPMFTPSHQSRLPKLKASSVSPLESSKSPPLPQAKTLPPSKIPTQPKSGQMSQQSRAGWKTPWKTQSKVDIRPQHPKLTSPGPESSSGSKYEGLPSSAQPSNPFYENELPEPASSSSPPARQPEPLQQVMESCWWPPSGI